MTSPREPDAEPDARHAKSSRRARRIVAQTRTEQARDERAITAKWSRLPAEEQRRQMAAWNAWQRRPETPELVADCHTLVDLATETALAAYDLARLAERTDRPTARHEWARAGARLRMLNNRYARAARRFARAWYGSDEPVGLPDRGPDSVERPESDTR